MTRLLAIAIKSAIMVFMCRFAVTYYDAKLPYIVQHPIVWVCLYIPLAMGYEQLIKIIITPFLKSKEETK